MRGYRLFPDISSVAVEWRIAGFRVRTILVLTTFVGIFLGAVGFVVSIWLGVSVLALTALLVFSFAVYIYHNDPDLVLGEVTMLSLLWKGSRRRYISNETKED